MRIESVTSAQNPKIKDLLALQEKSKERKKKGLFVVEGRRELLHCIETGYKPYTLFICRDIISDKDLKEITDAIGMTDLEKDCQMIEIPQHLYDKVAYRGGTEGVIAELHCKAHDLESLKLKENPVVVVMEAVEKPGNLGAVLRSADAAGVDAGRSADAVGNFSARQISIIPTLYAQASEEYSLSLQQQPHLRKPSNG